MARGRCFWKWWSLEGKLRAVVIQRRAHEAGSATGIWKRGHQAVGAVRFGKWYGPGDRGSQIPRQIQRAVRRQRERV